MSKIKATDRVALRPDPSMWKGDELMTLSEAAALLWPDGLLSEKSLRHAVKVGRLPISKVAGKYFVTLDSLRLLSVCTPLETPKRPRTGRPANPGFQEDLAIVRRLRGKE